MGYLALGEGCGRQEVPAKKVVKTAGNSYGLLFCGRMKKPDGTIARIASVDKSIAGSDPRVTLRMT